MTDIRINGVNINAQNVREIKQGISLEQVQKSIKDDGYDSIVFEKDNKAYIAWGDSMNFDGLKNLKHGSIPTTKLNGKDVNLILFENEINSAGEGALTALDNMKDIVIGGGTLFVKQGIGIVGGALTLGGFASLAKGVGTSGAIAMTKPLLGAAVKGLGRAGLWGAVAVAAGAAIYTGGMAIYGGVREKNLDGINSITK